MARADGADDLEIFLEVEIVEETTDSPPEFTQDKYSFSINEDDEDRTELGEVEATDDGQSEKSPYMQVYTTQVRWPYSLSLCSLVILKGFTQLGGALLTSSGKWEGLTDIHQLIPV